jgi:hypothetical protein
MGSKQYVCTKQWDDGQSKIDNVAIVASAPFRALLLDAFG